jgi:UDP-2-acetamido-2,6-beta-L-arabino-hexul-4-ose reductase
MRTVLVTGSNGFLGRNLCIALERCEEVEVLRFDVHNTIKELEEHIKSTEFVFHFAGVNRPKHEEEFAEGNKELTRTLCQLAEKHNSCAPILLSSSIQVEQESTYGNSKKDAENELIEYSSRTGVPVLIYRFPNIFGKWSKPHYNSVVATFCHNVTHDEEIQVNDPARVISFVYVDDVVEECLHRMRRASELDVKLSYYEVSETYSVSLGRLAGLVQAFRAVREGASMPDLSDPFSKKLYATFLSFYDKERLAYPVEMKTDNRGWLFELIKSEQFGQIFVSQTRPGIIRGNHGHDTKVEKFCVIKGFGIVRLRHLVTNEIVAHEVSEKDIQIVDIPPGYTHSIENVGETEMITLFWASEVFNPNRPDTYYKEVLAHNAG